MAEILVPRPAATVLILREDDGLEVLMLRRNLNSDFVGGAYVFPGGGVDAADADLARHVVGLNEESASARLGLESGGLSYYAAALRELFEEAGLLVVCNEAGEPLVAGAEVRARLDEYRAQLNAGRRTLAELLEHESWRLDVRAMEYLAHWITPVGPPRRYDTRFFVVVAPPGQVAAHDAGETVAARWIAPREALAAHDRGELEMIFPTIRTLEEIAGFATASEVLAFAA
ncbi:MAG TPA: NUDIX domain-containing protein, partial [Acidimicrobiales bacterium]|nr:NUDIX domain-containing protein [Acidimicrobiales bacterium]